jgi:hypothetical protein
VRFPCLKDGVKGLMMYLLIKGKEESLDIIEGDDWVKVREKPI